MYTDNPVFWTKLGLFLLLAILSISPTINYIRWRKELRANPAALPNATAIQATRKLIHMQFGLLFLLPILAAMMARGIGL